MSIKLCIADDHEIFRSGLELVINALPGLEIVAQARDGNNLLEKIDMAPPDIILMDIEMPGMGGVEATRIITRKYPEIKILALSLYCSDDLLMQMLGAGAKGYIMKTISQTELVLAIESVYKGKNYYSADTSHKMTELIAQGRGMPNYGRPKLSNIEIEIIKLICKELSSKEIAARLHFTPRTIENYREKIFEKIGTKNMAGIVVYAIQNRIFKV